MSGAKILFAAVVLALVATIVYGFIIAGGPSLQRGRALDSQVENNLASVGYALDVYFSKHGSVPNSLGELSNQPETYLMPEAAKGVEFVRKSEKDYELCASFAASSSQTYVGGPAPYPKAVPVGAARNWNHPAGRYCFEISLADNNAADCRLMRNSKTGAVGCFGCANGVCKKSTAGFGEYAPPPGSAGIPYACFADDQGCELAQ